MEKCVAGETGALTSTFWLEDKNSLLELQLPKSIYVYIKQFRVYCWDKKFPSSYLKKVKCQGFLYTNGYIYLILKPSQDQIIFLHCAPMCKIFL